MEALVRRASLAAPGEEQKLGERLASRDGRRAVPARRVRAARRRSAHDAPRAGAVPRLAADGPTCVVPAARGRARRGAQRSGGLAPLAGPRAVGERELQTAWRHALRGERACAPARCSGARAARSATRCCGARSSVGDPALRSAAARALAQRGTTAALPALVPRCASHPPRRARATPTAKARTSSEQAIRTLLDGADAACGDRVAALLEAESDGAPRRLPARHRAAARLHREPRAIRSVLELLLSDPSAAVRRAAVEALARVGSGSSSSRCAVRSPTRRRGPHRGRGGARPRRGDPGVVDDLASLLDDDEPRCVVAALRALAPGCARRTPTRRATARCCCCPSGSRTADPSRPRGARCARRDRGRSRRRRWRGTRSAAPTPELARGRGRLRRYARRPPRP